MSLQAKLALNLLSSCPSFLSRWEHRPEPSLDPSFSVSTPSCCPPTPAGNESAYEPNGAQCYSCLGKSREECQGTMPPVVNCYNASGRVYKGCFDGNVTLTAGEPTPEGA